MTKGRISLRWGEVMEADSKGKTGTKRRWQTKVIEIILRWMHDKWMIRCKLYQKPEKDLELQELYNECLEWWDARDTKGFLQTDAYLKSPRQAPRINQSKEHLREWIRTRRIAKEAYTRYKPNKKQPTLHKWLVRKPS